MECKELSLFSVNNNNIRLIDDIVECKDKKTGYNRLVKNRLIDDIVECKAEAEREAGGRAGD